MGFEATALIARPVDEVWAALTDWRRAPEWMSGIDGMAADGAATGEGTRLVFRSRGAERESTVVGWSPPNRLALQSVQGGVTALYEYACEPADGGTRLTLRAGCRAEGLGWRLALPLIGVLMKRADSGQVSALKRLIESAPS